MDSTKGSDGGEQRSDEPDFRYESGDAQQPWYVTGGEPPELLTPTPDETAPAASGTEAAAGSGSRRGGRRATVVGAVLAGVVATALGVGVVEASGSSGGATASAASRTAGGFPGGTGTQNGRIPAGRDGETHVTGTLTAVTSSSVTVRQAGGTSATYTVDSSTQVLANGKAVAVTALPVGDQVLVHAFPTNSGSAYAERVLAGSSATSGPMGGMPQGGPGTDSGRTTTTTAT